MHARCCLRIVGEARGIWVILSKQIALHEVVERLGVFDQFNALFAESIGAVNVARQKRIGQNLREGVDRHHRAQEQRQYEGRLIALLREKADEKFYVPDLAVIEIVQLPCEIGVARELLEVPDRSLGKGGLVFDKGPQALIARECMRGSFGALQKMRIVVEPDLPPGLTRRRRDQGRRTVLLQKLIVEAIVEVVENMTIHFHHVRDEGMPAVKQVELDRDAVLPIPWLVLCKTPVEKEFYRRIRELVDIFVDRQIESRDDVDIARGLE